MVFCLSHCGAKKPVNRTAKWFCCCTSDCEYFYDLTGTDGGKERSKTSIYRHLRDHAIPRDENNGRIINLEQTKCITATAARCIEKLGGAARYYQILMARTMIRRFLPFSFVDCGCVRAMIHDDYETQGPRAARSSIGEQFLSSAGCVRYLVSTMATSTNLLCGIRVNADLWTSKITVSCNCVENCVSVHLNLALRVSDDSTVSV